MIHTQLQHLDLVIQRPSKKNLYLIYHFPCKDGFGAAWAFMKALENKNSILSRQLRQDGVEQVHLIPESHRWEQTKKLLENSRLHQDSVIFLDICPPREMVQRVFEQAGSCKVFDHHKTAQEDCGDLPYCFFDMERSGAGISWDTFHGGPRIRLINAIEDGDIWRWTHPHSKEYLVVLETLRFDFKIWSEFAHELEVNPEKILEKGIHYDEYRQNVTRMLLGRKIHKIKVGGIVLAAANASIFQSGLGNILANKPGPAAAIYYTLGRGWNFSLRSNDRGPDVSKLAQQYGGGGHRNAAGFRVESLDQLEFSSYTEDELDEFEDYMWSLEKPQVITVLV
jgi:oligoribonuclease NrnB/cAMP/cGMP phosphodiesterase (DHH superfamily)